MGRENRVPQIVYAPARTGETAARRKARHRSIFELTPPARIYDLSETGRTADLANLARERHRPVTVIQNLPDTPRPAPSPAPSKRNLGNPRRSTR